MINTISNTKWSIPDFGFRNGSNSLVRGIKRDVLGLDVSKYKVGEKVHTFLRNFSPLSIVNEADINLSLKELKSKIIQPEFTVNVDNPIDKDEIETRTYNFRLDSQLTGSVSKVFKEKTQIPRYVQVDINDQTDKRVTYNHFRYIIKLDKPIILTDLLKTYLPTVKQSVPGLHEETAAISTLIDTVQYVYVDEEYIAKNSGGGRKRKSRKQKRRSRRGQRRTHRK